MFWYDKDILQAGITSGFSTADPERSNKTVQEAFLNTNMHPKDILVHVRRLSTNWLCVKSITRPSCMLNPSLIANLTWLTPTDNHHDPFPHPPTGYQANGQTCIEAITRDICSKYSKGRGEEL